MNKLFQIFVFSKLLIIVLISNSFSASTTGAADVYKVTMKKVELCTASTSVTDCENPIVIGNTEKTVDIAATDASRHKMDTVHMKDLGRSCEFYPPTPTGFQRATQYWMKLRRSMGSTLEE